MRRLEIGDVGEIQLVKSDSGIWKARAYYRDALGARRAVRGSGKSQRAARLDLMERVNKALESDTARESHTLSFGDAGDLWLAGIREKVDQGLRAEGTHRCYSQFWLGHIKPALGKIKVAELSTPVLDNFLTRLRANTSYPIAKSCRSVLSGICGQLVRQDLIPSNYVRDLAKLEAGRRRPPRALTHDEIRHWLAILDSSEYARRKDLPDLVRFFLATGLRLGEGLAITWADIDLAAKVVTAEWQITRVRGKGLQRSRTKTATSERTLALPRWCCQMLEARKVPKGATDPVFPSAAGTWRDGSNVARDLRIVRDGTAFEWFRSHVARRTVATLMDQAGSSAREVADQLGHARVSMTQDVYMGRKIASKSAADILESVVNPGG